MISFNPPLPFLFIIAILIYSCTEINTNPSISCDEPNPNELMVECNDIIKSTDLLTKSWTSNIDSDEYVLKFDKNGELEYSLKNNDTSEIAGNYSSSNYTLNVEGMGCSKEIGTGKYTYSIAFRGNHAELIFNLNKDECESRVNILLSNNWKYYY